MRVLLVLSCFFVGFVMRVCWFCREGFVGFVIRGLLFCHEGCWFCHKGCWFCHEGLMLLT